MITAYDEIEYPSATYPETHPDRLATHAKLFGMTPAAPSSCRVLEVGGGAGANTIAMAVGSPNSEFVSFDLASSAIREGQAVVDALGLTNVRMMQADLLTADVGFEPFDYIIAHGVYSWVPAPVRDGLLALISDKLAPRGVAFVSYNANPGCHVRQAMRDILMFKVRNIEGRRPKSEAAYDYLRTIAETFPEKDHFQALLKQYARSALKRPVEVLAHDDLSEIYHPVLFHEFLAHASRHRLQFLTEAEAARCGEGFLPPYALDDPEFDILAHAQDMDITSMRTFRQTLLVHADLDIPRRPAPERLRILHVASAAKRSETGDFITPTSKIAVTDPELAAALEKISEVYPRTVPVTDVVHDPDREAALLRMYWVGVVILHAEATTFPTAPGDKPEANRLARYQAASGATLLNTVNHQTVEVLDGFSLQFIAKLDGKRTRAEILYDLKALNGVGDDIELQLDNNLQALAKMPLLVR